jgi:hypothetical protein
LSSFRNYPRYDYFICMHDHCPRHPMMFIKLTLLQRESPDYSWIKLPTNLSPRMPKHPIVSPSNYHYYNINLIQQQITRNTKWVLMISVDNHSLIGRGRREAQEIHIIFHIYTVEPPEIRIPLYKGQFSMS